MPLKMDTVEEPELNLTPMIDIVMLLVIFFMVGTQFTQAERQYEIELPTVTDAQPLTVTPDEIVVSVRQDGELFVGADAITMSELQSMLSEAQSAYSQQAVVIRGDADARYQRIMDVLEIVGRAEITNVQLPNRLKGQ